MTAIVSLVIFTYTVGTLISWSQKLKVITTPTMSDYFTQLIKALGWPVDLYNGWRGI